MLLANGQDKLGPTAKRSAALIEVQGSVVNAGHAAFRRSADVVHGRLNHMRRDPGPLIHDGHHRASEIVQRPMRQGGQSCRGPAFRDSLIKSGLRFAEA